METAQVLIIILLVLWWCSEQKKQPSKPKQRSLTSTTNPKPQQTSAWPTTPSTRSMVRQTQGGGTQVQGKTHVFQKTDVLLNVTLTEAQWLQVNVLWSHLQKRSRGIRPRDFISMATMELAKIGYDAGNKATTDFLKNLASGVPILGPLIGPIAGWGLGQLKDKLFSRGPPGPNVLELIQKQLVKLQEAVDKLQPLLVEIQNQAAFDVLAAPARQGAQTIRSAKSAFQKFATRAVEGVPPSDEEIVRWRDKALDSSSSLIGALENIEDAIRPTEPGVVGLFVQSAIIVEATNPQSKVLVRQLEYEKLWAQFLYWQSIQTDGLYLLIEALHVSRENLVTEEQKTEFIRKADILAKLETQPYAKQMEADRAQMPNVPAFARQFSFVVSKATGLMWALLEGPEQTFVDPSANPLTDFGPRLLQIAMDKASGTYEGLSGWRLPKADEVVALMEMTGAQRPTNFWRDGFSRSGPRPGAYFNPEAWPMTNAENFWKTTLGFPAPQDQETVWQFVVDVKPPFADVPESPPPRLEQAPLVGGYRSDVNVIWPVSLIDLLPLQQGLPTRKADRSEKLRRWRIMLVRQHFEPLVATRLPEGIKVGDFFQCQGDPRVWLVSNLGDKNSPKYQKRHVLHPADLTGPVLQTRCDFLNLIPVGTPYYRAGPWRAS